MPKQFKLSNENGCIVLNNSELRLEKLRKVLDKVDVFKFGFFFRH